MVAKSNVGLLFARVPGDGERGHERDAPSLSEIPLTLQVTWHGEPLLK